MDCLGHGEAPPVAVGPTDVVEESRGRPLLELRSPTVHLGPSLREGPICSRRRKKPKNGLILGMTLTCWAAAQRDKGAKGGSLKSEIADLGSLRTLCVLNLHDSGFAFVPVMVDANSDDESNDEQRLLLFCIWRTPATLQACAKAYDAMSS